MVSGAGSTATDSTAFYNQNPRAFGYIAGSVNWGDHGMGQDLDQTTSTIFTQLPDIPTNASFADGFTVAITVNSNNTWSIVTTGLSTNADGTGGYAGTLDTGVNGFDFATFITGGIGLNSSLQNQGQSVTISQATLVAVPEPEAIALMASAVSLLGLRCARRRRANR